MKIKKDAEEAAAARSQEQRCNEDLQRVWRIALLKVNYGSGFWNLYQLSTTLGLEPISIVHYTRLR